MKTVICSDMKMLKKLMQTGLFALLLSAAAAHGADLAQAKAAGMVGERADGYLGLVQENAPADVVALVKDVNSKRRDEYRRIAESNDLSLEEVQATYTLTGDADYLIHVRVRSLDELANFVHRRLLPHPRVAQVRSDIVLERVGRRKGIPL